MKTTRTLPTVYKGYIGQMLVSSAFRYIVYGSVRGLVSEHRTASGAERSLTADRKGCKAQGGYSDANVYAIDRAGVEGWRVIA